MTSYVSAQTEERVDQLLEQLTLEEKVSLLSGRDVWHTVAIERLGIPSIVMTDGPHGVRAAKDGSGRPYEPATSFPTGISMAASWNPALIEKVGRALGEETRALGCHILLGPCVNIVRSPLGGRNFEAYAEDPYLAGRIGVAWVNGLQSVGIGASLKHFACNNQETERMRGSSEVDERTLREIYLPAFEAVVHEAQPWTVMCAYNRLNGTYASENEYLLRFILKDEWGFQGAVVSDWGAVHTTNESLLAGMDIEMPGPAKYYGRLALDAVRTWQVPRTVIDEAVRRILRLIVWSGAMDGSDKKGPSALNTPAHAALARELAEESITLLKNEGNVLPLERQRIKKLAVIGPNASEARYGGGGSSFVNPPYSVSPLEGIRALVGDDVKIVYEEGATNWVVPPSMPAGLFPSGLKAEFFNNTDFAGQPVLTRTDERIDTFWWNSSPDPLVNADIFSVRWSGKLKPTASGDWTLLLANTHLTRLYIDGKLAAENNRGNVSRHQLRNDPFSLMATATIPLEAGREYDLRLELVHDMPLEVTFVRLMHILPQPEHDPIEAAVAAARGADAAVIFAGMPTYFETEGNDRPHMDLPGKQTELIRAVAAANPNTIVVVNAGAPVSMPWVNDVPAVLEAYYFGQEGGNAIARILFGDVNPSGKLPVSFPVDLQQNPAFLNFPGRREVYYGERIYVGYRYYDTRGVEPMFSFGHGLSYTTFEYSQLSLPQKAANGQSVQISLQVRNSGAHAGKEVVQLYVRDVKACLDRPFKELKGFQKVELQPGESQTVTFTLTERAFAFYDVEMPGWRVEPGEFEILIGSSSRDLRLTGIITIE